MKKLITVILFCLAAESLCGQIPNVRVEDEKGDAYFTASIVESGMPVLISFWSTTCKPCLRELNAINELFGEWSAKADFRVVAVSVDDSRSVSRAKVLARGYGWDDFTLLYDKNQDFQRAMNVSLVPHAFILDGDGKIVYSHTGYTPGNEDELFKIILENQNHKKP